jgi:hypothetical protein
MIELGATVAGQEAPALDSVDITARSVAITGNRSVMDERGNGHEPMRSGATS